ncbi:MAG: HD domain-containing phosphohydrolase [Pseudomonadota bacterium]
MIESVSLLPGGLLVSKLNPDITVHVTVLPPESPLADRVRQAAEGYGLCWADPGSLSSDRGAPRIWLLDRSADPQAALPRGPGGPDPAGEAILVAAEPDPDFFDSIAPDQVEQRLPYALVHLARQAQLRHQVRQEEEAVTILNEIGHALSAIPDRTALLHAVLFQTRRVVKADGGSLYLVRDDDHLVFGAAQNDTVDFEEVAASIPIDDSSLAGYVANHGVVQVIEDAYDLPPDAPYSFNTEFDRRCGYCTRTMLTVPMRDRQGRIIAVVSLINRKARFGVPMASFEEAEPFNRRDVALVRSIAAQAAVALENHRLYDDIRRLFDGFVDAAMSGIEVRDPATGGHSHRVAALTVALARAVNDSKLPAFAGQHFTPDDLIELHYAALLHDFGKVGVREEVLLKAEKLFPWELEEIEARLRLYSSQLRARQTFRALRPLIAARRLAEITAVVAAIHRLNRPGARLEGADAEAVRTAAGWRLEDDGSPVLRPRDLERLAMAKGSLSAGEREEINAHVEHTSQFLERIPWTSWLQNVPALALGHHERLDGSGYPRGLTAEQIPSGSKIMAICDVFDALTAGDRPYRSAMGLDRGLHILQLEARAGKLDPDMVQLFVERRVWEGITPTSE